MYCRWEFICKMCVSINVKMNNLYLNVMLYDNFQLNNNIIYVLSMNIQLFLFSVNTGCFRDLFVRFVLNFQT